MKTLPRLLLSSVAVMVVLAFSCNVIGASRKPPAGECSTLLKQNARQFSTSEAVLSVLKELFDNKIINSDDLVVIGSGQNPLRKRRTKDAVDYATVIDVILDRLRQAPKAKLQLDRFVQRTVRDQQKEKSQTAQTRQVFLPMTMHSVPQISRSVRFANIPVTQWQYALVMGRNPSKFQTGEGSINVTIGDKSVLILPNHPVENLDRYEARQYIINLNRLSDQDDPLIYKIVKNHLRGAHFRLLTAKEWEELALTFGIKNNAVTIDTLKKYEWYFANSNLCTRPVAELHPYDINGHLFYDLVGNVKVWTRNMDTRHGSCNGVVRGSGWTKDLNDLQSSQFSFLVWVGLPLNDLGIRLVEILPPTKKRQRF